MRNAASGLLVLASLTGVASADLLPEDPYTDATPTPVMTSESAHATSLILKSEQSHSFEAKPVEVAAVAKSEPTKSSTVPASITSTTSESTDQLDDEWYEQQEVQIGGGIGAGLLLLGLLIRGRRAARRRRLALLERKTQFGMSAVDPALAKIAIAAWEQGPAIMPIAIEPEMITRRAPSAPLIQQPYELAPIAQVSEPIVRFAPQPHAAPIAHQVPSRIALPNAHAAPAPQHAAHAFAPPQARIASQQVAPAHVAPAPQHVAQDAPSSFAPAAVAPSPFAPPSQPYRHYSEADLDAYRMRPQQPAPARRKSEPKLVMMPHMMAPAPIAQPSSIPAPQRSSIPSLAQHAATPGAQPPRTSIPSLPQPQGSWHPTVMPWDQAQPSHGPQPFTSQSFAPAPAPQPVSPHAFTQGSEPPHAFNAAMAQYHARAFQPAPAINPENVRLARLADGTPHPPYSLQAFTGLPGLPPHTAPTIAPHLAAHAAPTVVPQLQQSFVLERSSSELPKQAAAYPLTFPAFPETAGATMLAPIEPSGLNYWGQETEVEVEDEQIVFARGSQPVEHLDPLRVTLPRATPDAETRIAPSPLDKRTLPMPRR